MPIEEFPGNDYERYEAEKARLHRLHERLVLLLILRSVINNTEVIRNAYMIHGDTPQTPSMPVNTYQKMNDIEKILDDVYGILLNNFNYYCGSEIYAGDDTGLLL